MQRKGANISLKGYDDIFSTEQSRAESQQERVQEIPLSELHPFEGHPFLSLIHISEPTRRSYISYAVFCLKKKK